jgi:hypothetical protein
LVLGFKNQLEGWGFFVDLRAHRCRAVSTEIFIFISFRQDEKQSLPHGHGRFAVGTIEGSCLKFLKTGLFHLSIIKEMGFTDNEEFRFLFRQKRRGGTFCALDYTIKMNRFEKIDLKLETSERR